MSFEHLSSSHQPESNAVVRTLQRQALVRSMAYAGGINLIGLAASYVVNPERNRAWSMPLVLANHSLAAPFMVGLTYAFVRLREEDRAWWHRVLLKDGTRQLLVGIALGGGVYLAETGAAMALGWVHFGPGGWYGSAKTAVIWTLVSHLANLCVAWNEEMLYRGYGLHSLTEAIGLPGAVVVLVPLFAWGHGEGWQTFIGQSTFALTMTALRLVGKSLWLPVGYHAAWNYMQTAVLGAPDARPSLLPMHVDGPQLWLGRPGYPVPGMLSIVVNLVVATVATFVWWHTRKQSSSHPH